MGGGARSDIIYCRNPSGTGNSSVSGPSPGEFLPGLPKYLN